jgi:histidinol phosphatase-like enzyme (inositol monophosphatase family)
VRSIDLAGAAAAAEVAADLARAEILPRFRDVTVESKPDGSPVTEADRAAERVIRQHLQAAYPQFGVLGEEYGSDGPAEGPQWIIDPIDGTIGFSRGIPLFSTLIALAVDGVPVVGLIDLPTLDERYVGWSGGGCHRNGRPARVSSESDLKRAIVSHGDPFCFDLYDERPALEHMLREIPMLRGYTDAFGHALVLGGGVGAMVDLGLNLWDAAATQVLVPEAGGRCDLLPERHGKLGLVFGSHSLVEQLLDFLSCAKNPAPTPAK